MAFDGSVTINDGNFSTHNIDARSSGAEMSADSFQELLAVLNICSTRKTSAVESWGGLYSEDGIICGDCATSFTTVEATLALSKSSQRR